MGLYAVTGGATGIGAGIKARLQQSGHTVIVIDIKDADIVADLSSAEGRQSAISEIGRRAKAGLDGLVTCAGVGANVTDNVLITQLNYFGTVELVKGCKDWLQSARGSVLLIASTAAPSNDTPDYVETLLAGDADAACDHALNISGHSAYSGTKQAVTRWMRRHVEEFASAGVRMNAIAPGYTHTPLNEAAEQTAEYGDAIRRFKASIPVGFAASPDDQAAVACFLMSAEARFVCGAVVFVDGGHDAVFRPDQF